MTTKRRITFYLAIVFGITYPCWITAAVLSQVHADSPLIFPLHLLGGSGPFVGTIIYLIKTKEWKDFSHRLTHIRQIPLGAWLIALSPILIITLTHFFVYQGFHIDDDFRSMGALYGIGLLFFGPIPEETGWRGILFNDLNTLSFKKAQFFMTLTWFLWHLPLFFIVGSYQHGLGLFSVDFLFFSINIVVQSLIMGYLFLIGNKQIVLPILFHYAVNLFGEMLTRNIASEIITISLYTMLFSYLHFTHGKSIKTR